VESCDGTGWLRHPRRSRQLEGYLMRVKHGLPDAQYQLPGM
jgi:hypothetical protein